MTKIANAPQPKVLQVTDVETKRDSRKNDDQPEGREYKIITVRAKKDAWVDVPGVGRVAAKGKIVESRFVAYPKNYLNQMDPGADARKGDYLLGDIITVATTPYSILNADGTTREVDTYTFVVLGDTTEKTAWVREVNQTFVRRMTVVGPNGMRTLRCELIDPAYTMIEEKETVVDSVEEEDLVEVVEDVDSANPM